MIRRRSAGGRPSAPASRPDGVLPGARREACQKQAGQKGRKLGRQLRGKRRKKQGSSPLICRPRVKRALLQHRPQLDRVRQRRMLS